MESIALFDSGLGGLSVFKEITRLLPHEHLIYFGDTARIPYGNKSPETIIRYALENSHFLLKHPLKLLIVACNTATAHALPILEKSLSIPVMGVIKGGSAKAIAATKTGHICILATKGTVQSQAYEKAIKAINPDIQVSSYACPFFVPIVEENYISHEIAQIVVKEHLKECKKSSVDTVILGCTHYPLLKELIQKEFGENVTIIDSAQSCAENVFQLFGDFKANQMIPRHQFYVSDDPQQFQKNARQLFNIDVENIALVTF